MVRLNRSTLPLVRGVCESVPVDELAVRREDHDTPPRITLMLVNTLPGVTSQPRRSEVVRNLVITQHPAVQSDTLDLAGEIVRTVR